MRRIVRSFCTRINHHFNNEMKLIDDIRSANLTGEEYDQIADFMCRHPHALRNMATMTPEIAAKTVEAVKKRSEVSL